MDRRALVLGGGGVTGIAWEIGVIAGLADQGIDLTAADVIIGTSAGSVVGADITCGQEPEVLYRAQLAPPDPEPAARIGWGLVGRLTWVMNTSRDPVRARARIGRWALAARTMPEADRFALPSTPQDGAWSGEICTQFTQVLHRISTCACSSAGWRGPRMNVLLRPADARVGDLSLSPHSCTTSVDVTAVVDQSVDRHQRSS